MIIGTSERLLIIIIILKSSLADFDFEREINTISNEIIRIYFSGSPCVIYITDTEDYSFPDWAQQQFTILVNLNYLGKRPNILREIYDLSCVGFVVRVSDRKNVSETLVQSYKRSTVSRYNNKRYLFLPLDKDDEDVSFLEMSYMFYMPDLVLVTPVNNSTKFNLLTHNYFDGYKYDELKERFEVVEVWHPEEGFQRNQFLYPDKIANLKGKLIILAALQYGPYSVVIKDGDRVIYDGLETRIVAEFASLRNATWEGKDHPTYLWGDIFDNETGNGVLGSIYEHKADIGIGAIYQWHCDVLECSYPYIYAGVTCLVPKPLRISGWYTIILPFEPNVWAAILVTYLSCSVFVFFIAVMLSIMENNKEEKPGMVTVLLESFFSTFRIQLEQSPRDTGNRSPLYGFFKFWTVYCFFVAACWQGGIASFLTVPRYEEPINDAHDLVARWPKLEWGGNHIDWTKSIEQTTEPIMAKIVKEFVVLDDKTLRERTKARNFGHFMERLPNGHYGMNEYIDEEQMNYLRIMESNIYTANCVMVLPKCSPYLESLDKMLFWMFDTGLIQKLEIQSSLEIVNNRLQNKIRTSTERDKDEDVALLISHIQGAMFTYAFGITLSLVVFLSEMFYRGKM